MIANSLRRTAQKTSPKPTTCRAPMRRCSKPSTAIAEGQQRVTVEHIHAHAGGQAVVARSPGLWGRDRSNLEEQPRPKQLSLAHEPTLPSRTRAGTLCQSPAMPNRALPDARRQRCRARPKGNSRALRHGRYTAAAMAERRELGALLRDKKDRSRFRIIAVTGAARRPQWAACFRQIAPRQPG
jgi:hypothetical protein